MSNTWSPEQYALIEKHYPDALMNPGDEYRDQPGTRYDLHGIVGFCGCGMPDEAARWLLSVLTLIGRPRVERAEFDRYFKEEGAFWRGIPDGVRYLILYWIDHMGWTTHGGSVTGSWLEEKGRAAMVVLEMLIAEEACDE